MVIDKNMMGKSIRDGCYKIVWKRERPLSASW